jgi:hypothetical protein
VPFTASRLWQPQRQFFAPRGRHGWRDGAVPHELTSNPAMAAATAEGLVAFRLDRLRINPAPPRCTIRRMDRSVFALWPIRQQLG